MMKRTSILALAAAVTLVASLPTGSAQAASPLTPEQVAVERAAILQMVGAAMLHLNNLDYDRFSTYFVPDGSMSLVNAFNPAMNKKASITEMVKVLKQTDFMGDNIEMRHMTGNFHVVFADATHATLQGPYMVAMRSKTNTFSIGDTGSYNSKLVKVNGKWLFQEYNVVNGPKSPVD